MTRLRYLVVSSALLAGATTARAIPSAANWSIPSHILLVGRVDAVADTAIGAFTVVVRDLANNPVAGSTVEIRILNCPGAQLATDPYQPNVTIACGTHGAKQSTNTFGEVRMTLV